VCAAACALQRVCYSAPSVRVQCACCSVCAAEHSSVRAAAHVHLRVAGCVAVCVLQCVLQCVAVFGGCCSFSSVLQCAAVHMLQRVYLETHSVGLQLCVAGFVAVCVALCVAECVTECVAVCVLSGCAAVC